MENVFFVVGFPRSGTSFMVQLLNLHPAISAQHESKFIPRYLSQFKKLWELKKLEQIATDLNLLLEPKVKQVRYTGIYRKEDILANLQQSQNEEALTAYRRLLAEIMGNKDKPSAIWIGDKTPDYVFFIPQLLEIFPQANFIHIVRDPRNVYISIKNLTWGPDNPLSLALSWKKYLEAWENHKHLIPESQQHELRYEDLTHSPESTIKKLLSFFEVPLSDFPLQDTGVKKNYKSVWTNRFLIQDIEVIVICRLAEKQLLRYGYEPHKAKLPFFYLLLLLILIDQGWRRIMNKIYRIPLKLTPDNRY